VPRNHDILQVEEMGSLSGAISLPHVLFLRQFCSPLLGFIQFAPGFIEVDYVVTLFSYMWVSVTESEEAPSQSFNEKRFCLIVSSLLRVELGKPMHGARSIHEPHQALAGGVSSIGCKGSSACLYRP
jgi:hypothetical protein